MHRFLAGGVGLAVFWLAPLPAPAWDYEVHRFINHLALASLPAEYPAFVRAPAAQERIAFLGGEPDRWRNTPDLGLRHLNSPDHFINLEDLALYGLRAPMLGPFRYELVAQLCQGRADHPLHFKPVDLAKDPTRTHALIGFLPWTVSEQYSKLKSAFSYLKVFERAGTPEEIANAQENVIYLMGVLGHFVGDATQPLHTTKHYNGWVGKNPRGFTTNRSFHAWIDAGFLRQTGVETNGVLARVRPGQLPWWGSPATAATNAFPEILAFVVDQSKQVEPLYRLEKDGALSPASPKARVGRDFLTEQLLKAGQMLGDLWFAAWQQAGPDKFLQDELARRKKAGT